MVTKKYLQSTNKFFTPLRTHVSIKKVWWDPVACQVGNCPTCTKIKQWTPNKLTHSVTGSVTLWYLWYWFQLKTLEFQLKTVSTSFHQNQENSNKGNTQNDTDIKKLNKVESGQLFSLIKCEGESIVIEFILSWTI